MRQASEVSGHQAAAERVRAVLAGLGAQGVRDRAREGGGSMRLGFDAPKRLLDAPAYLEGDAEAAQFMARRFFEADLDYYVRTGEGPRRTLARCFVPYGSIADPEEQLGFQRFKARVIGVYDADGDGVLPDAWVPVDEWRLGRV